MEDVKPSTWLLLGGGLLLLISTFLEWVSVGPFGENAWNTDFFGLLGIFCAIIGLVVGGGTAAVQFGNLSLPDSIMGFDMHQIDFILATIALVITLGLIVRGDVGIGLFLALIASAAILAGAVMNMRGPGAAASPPPSQF